MQTCDPDWRLNHIVATPGLLSSHQPVSAKWQIVIIAGHQVPGDGAEGIVRIFICLDLFTLSHFIVTKIINTECNVVVVLFYSPTLQLNVTSEIK